MSYVLNLINAKMTSMASTNTLFYVISLIEILVKFN